MRRHYWGLNREGNGGSPRSGILFAKQVRRVKPLIKASAYFFAAAVVVVSLAETERAHAQTHPGNLGYTNGSVNARPGSASNRRFGNFAHRNDPFRGWSRFHGDFGRRDIGTNIVVVPPAPYYGAPPPPDYGGAPYYGVSPPDYDSLRCYLHRPVQTPNGPILEPVYVC